jgi:glycosyltransferase involved in cell wall biosynthesis
LRQKGNNLPNEEPLKFSIIIPVFNEEKTVSLLLKKIHLLKFRNIQKEIFIVNDGSTDQTTALLKRSKITNCLIQLHDKNQGKGAAIRTAQPYTTGDFVIIQDADLEYDPEDYQKLLEPLLREETDVVYGSRFKGEHHGFSFFNYVGNEILTFCSNLLFNSQLTDIETCYKVFRGPLFRGLTLRSQRFEFDIEVTAKILKRGYKILEVPITYNGRDHQNGKKLIWKDGLLAFISLIRYRFLD